MSYSTLLAEARILALNALLEALKAATDPAEIRRIAQAIFKAPKPDEELDRSPQRPPPTSIRPSTSATSPERSEGTGPTEPATAFDQLHATAPRQLDAPNAPRAPSSGPSLRSGFVANVLAGPEPTANSLPPPQPISASSRLPYPLTPANLIQSLPALRAMQRTLKAQLRQDRARLKSLAKTGPPTPTQSQRV